MGLDITAYSNLKKEVILDGLDIDQVYDNKWTYFYDHGDKDCYQHIDIDCTFVYSYEHRKSMRAGSYGGYSSWRNELRNLARTLPVDENGYYPFYTLINYSDCEGVIGTMCSIKLAKDFTNYEEAACIHFNEYCFEKYLEWKSIFELAANNGAVKFH